MLRVSRQPSGEPEIFRSIQGEGVSVGAPCVFLRLATCNLSCTWCDTKYTWDWTSFSYENEVMTLTPGEVEARVLDLGGSRLVVTGGEPMLQQAELAPLAAALRGRSYSIEVETNGTLEPSPDLAAAVTQWNVSPKLANSGNRPDRMTVPAALRAYAALDTAFFKFVIVRPADVDEVDALVVRYGVARERVLLMPEGASPDVLSERGAWLAEVCAERDFRYTPRLHIVLWGDVRGR